MRVRAVLSCAAILICGTFITPPVSAEKNSNKTEVRSEAVLSEVVSFGNKEEGGLPGLPSGNTDAIREALVNFQKKPVEITFVQVEYQCNFQNPQVGCRTTGLLVCYRNTSTPVSPVTFMGVRFIDDDPSNDGFAGLPSENRQMVSEALKLFYKDPSREILNVQAEYFCNFQSPQVGCRTTGLLVFYREKH